MTESEFGQLAAKGFNRVPLVRELFADLDTPLSVYYKLANKPWSYLLESVQGGERFGRYSFIGLPARTVLRVHNHFVSVEEDGKPVEQSDQGDPLTFVEDYLARFKAAAPQGLPRFPLNLRTVWQRFKNGTSSKGDSVPSPQRRKENLLRSYFVIFCGLIAALVIQIRFGIEEIIGGFFISCLLLYIFYKDIMRYKPTYVKKHTMLLLPGLIVIGTLFIERIFGFLLLGLSKGLEYRVIESALYGIPVATGAMHVSLIFDFHTAITFSFLISLLTGLWLHDAAFTIYAFVSSITAAFGAIRCKKRSSILKAGGYVIVVNIVTVIFLPENLSVFLVNCIIIRSPLLK